VETIQAMQQRASQALAIIQARPESTILVVSHGAFGRAVRRVMLGLPYTDEYIQARPHGMIPNATIVELIAQPQIATPS
jgi:broad specificity phosphatase PhoE